jgi:hypothetical protein
MDLHPGGIDAFYIDESERHPLSVVTVVRVPFLRPQSEKWQIVWPDYLRQATTWRRELSARHNIRFRPELHGYKILKHQGLYHKEGRNLSPDEAVALYRDALGTLSWLPSNSVMSSVTYAKTELMGHKGIGAALFGIFQRLRSQCDDDKVIGLLFFDEGHEQYVRLYRKAQVYMPTGSRQGAWEDGKPTKNLPLSMFPKDANMKISKLSYFTQIADLICYAVRLKIEGETNALAAKRRNRNHHTVYDALPADQINKKATSKRQDGIVPI